MSHDPSEERVPYHRYAFKNVYNYTLLGGLAAAALLTANPWLLVLAGGAEALWMLFAPDSKLLRRFWFDKVHEEELCARAERALEAKITTLSLERAVRVRTLSQARQKIMRLAKDNQAFTGSLMQTELSKLEKLVHDFADLAVATTRYESHIASVDLGALEESARYQEKLIENAEDSEARALARKNLDVLLRRQEKQREIHTFVQRARAQMELIENTFALLTDQIVTMRSPRELHGQLDDLLDGVDAVRATAREAEVLLEHTTDTWSIT